MEWDRRFRSSKIKRAINNCLNFYGFTSIGLEDFSLYFFIFGSSDFMTFWFLMLFIFRFFNVFTEKLIMGKIKKLNKLPPRIILSV